MLQVSLTVEVEILQGPHGPTLRVCNCIAHVEYVDVCIEDGGIIGQLANSFFRVRQEIMGRKRKRDNFRDRSLIRSEKNSLDNSALCFPMLSISR